MSFFVFVVRILLIFSFLFCSKLASAQTEPDSEAAVCPGQLSIDDALKQGIKLRELKTVDSNKKAYELFLCVYNKTNNLPTVSAKHSEALVQLYKAEMVLGMWVEARGHVNEALTKEDEYVSLQLVRDTMNTDLELIKKFVGSIEITARDGKNRQSLTKGSVLINGRLLSPLPMSAPLDLSVGKIPFEITAPGYYSDKPELTVLSNRLVRYDANLTRIPLYKKWQFWVVIGSAAAVVATGIGLGVYYGTKDIPDREIILKF